MPAIKRIRETWRRLGFYLRRERFDRELDAEMRFHLEMKAREKMSDGMESMDARTAAQRQFGNQTRLKERSREMWTIRWIDEIGRNLRQSFRMIRKTPVLAGVIILSLALAIGANTAIFTLVNAVLLKPLPVRNPNELVLFGWSAGAKTAGFDHRGSIRRDPVTKTRRGSSLTFLSFQRMMEQNQTLSDLFAFAPIGDNLNLSVDRTAGIASGQFVSGGYYRGLGVSAVLGRTIDDNDDKPGAEPVAVITYKYWNERFGLDRSVVGKSAFVNGLPFTIIGVTSPGFEGTLDIGRTPDLTLPLITEPLVDRGPARDADPSQWWLRVMGRLKAGASIEQARANLEPVMQQCAMESFRDRLAKAPDLRLAQLDTPPGLTAVSGSRGEFVARQDNSKQLYSLLIVVGLVLLIACVNTANLLFARSSARQKEIAIRMALGASRLGLIGQLLTESLTLALMGGLTGLILAYWLKNFLVIVSPFGGAPLKIDLKLDWRVLSFAAAILIATGILFGIVPALKTTKVDPGPVLKNNTTYRKPGGGRVRIGKVLVVVQVSLSVIVLVGSSLFIRTLRNLQNVDYGFDASNILLFDVNPSLNGYKDENLANVYQQIADRVGAIPGVRAASMSMFPMLSGAGWERNGLKVTGAEVQPDGNMGIYLLPVRQNFLDVMHIPVLRGRNLNDGDTAASTTVAVVNQAFARLAFKDEDPIGRLFSFERDDKLNGVQIVGVARDTLYDDLRSGPPPIAYLSLAQHMTSISRGGSGLTFEVSGSDDPTLLVASIRQTLQTIDGNLAIMNIKTQTHQIDDLMTNERLFANFGGGFGVLALLLACLGLYGVISYSVSRRTSEIGIRMALGAEPGRVLKLIMREAMLLVVVGLVVGIGASIASTRLVATFLFGLAPNDPLSIGFAVVVLLVVGIAACYLPARRAARVDPVTAIRYD